MADKPDFTAWFVLQGLIAAIHHKLFRADKNKVALNYLLPLASQASKQRPISRFIHALPYSWQYRIGNLTTNPDRLRHFYLRKQEIEKQTRQILSKSEVTQVVVLGAGLDVLTMCLATEFPDIKFIEVDLPASQQFKRWAFAEQQMTVAENIEFIEGDLRNPLADIMAQSASYRTDGKTLWIAEGFLMFIPEESVVRLFKEIAELSAAESPFIFTTLPRKKYTSTFNYLLQTVFFAKEKCPFDWVIPCEDAQNFIRGAGLKPKRQIHYTELHKDFIDESHNRPEESIHIATT